MLTGFLMMNNKWCIETGYLILCFIQPTIKPIVSARTQTTENISVFDCLYQFFNALSAARKQNGGA